ncbi:interferon alpha-F-like [Vanacampus margaritifer]
MTSAVRTIWAARTMWTTSVALVVIVLQLHSIHVMTAAVPACDLPGNVVLEAQNLLQDLGALFPVRCLPYNANATFPRSALANSPQCQWALEFLYKSLQGAEQVFEDYDFALGEGGLAWDLCKLDDFQNLQNGLLQESSCLSRATDVNPDPDLSSYFGNVSALLQQQDSATCGWSVLRRDVLWVLKTTLHQHHSCFRW